MRQNVGEIWRAIFFPNAVRWQIFARQKSLLKWPFKVIHRFKFVSCQMDSLTFSLCYNIWSYFLIVTFTFHFFFIFHFSLSHFFFVIYRLPKKELLVWRRDTPTDMYSKSLPNYFSLLIHFSCPTQTSAMALQSLNKKSDPRLICDRFLLRTLMTWELKGSIKVGLVSDIKVELAILA